MGYSSHSDKLRGILNHKKLSYVKLNMVIKIKEITQNGI